MIIDIYLSYHHSIYFKTQFENLLTAFSSRNVGTRSMGRFSLNQTTIIQAERFIGKGKMYVKIYVAFYEILDYRKIYTGPGFY